VLSLRFHSSTLDGAVDLLGDVGCGGGGGATYGVEVAADDPGEAGLMRHSGSSQRHSVVRLMCESASDRVGERV
jgi:hypothetical protein